MFFLEPPDVSYENVFYVRNRQRTTQRKSLKKYGISIMQGLNPLILLHS